MRGTPASLPQRLQSRLAEPPRDVPGGRAAAVAALLCPGADGPEVLLMRRAERAGDRWSGQIALPGGFFQPADGHLLATAQREAQEELGLDLPSAGQLLGALSLRSPVRQSPDPVAVLPLVFWSPKAPVTRLSAEAVEAFWLPLGAVQRGERDSRYLLELPDRVEEFPAWSAGPQRIWGLTLRILSELLEHLKALETP